MTYERRKRFVLDYLVDGVYSRGLTIVEASNGLLRKKSSYNIFERMVGENLIRVRGGGRAWEREYRKLKPWENN